MQVVTPPWAVPTAAGTSLVYEVLLSDYPAAGLELQEVEVFGDGDLLRTYTAAELLSEDYTAQAVLALPQAAPAKAQAVRCTQPVLYFSILLGQDEAVPEKISHRFHFTGGTFPRGDAFSVRGGRAGVRDGALPVIGPPMRGDRMAASESLAPSTHHRKGIVMVDGKPFISQRFAIDWVRLTEQGTMAGGTAPGLESYAGYRQELLAVAAGTVVKVVEGVPDNQTPPDRDIEITDETIAGNLVVLQIAENIYAFYGHCIPGSILVREGDEVAAGQVLALMGNSGNSDLPHLHFHLADGLDLFGSQGVPFVTDHFVWQADFPYWTSDDSDFAGWARDFSWTPRETPEPRAGEFFSNGMVVVLD